jgi:hypothetical protein
MSGGVLKVLIPAVCTLLGSVVTAVVGPVVLRLIDDKKSKEARKASGIAPGIMGTTWKAEWNFEDGTPYTKEYVTFEKWTKDFQFQGYGYVDHDGQQYKYPITGLISPTRIVALTWTAEGFPAQGANIGTACLRLSPNSKQLDGKWAGLAQTDGDLKLRAGSVAMVKVRSEDLH